MAELRGLVLELREMLAARDEVVARREARIAELEKLLEESRRSGKRQAAPFSKGAPVEEPKTPGRRSGPEHGQHGHRMAPTHIDRELHAPLPPCCPDCGGELDHERRRQRVPVESVRDGVPRAAKLSGPPRNYTRVI